MFKLQSFSIRMLHKSININLSLEENILILLGENGSCKTTILKILYYTLSCQWKKLKQFDFQEINLVINDTPFTIEKKDLQFARNIRENNFDDSYLLHLIDDLGAPRDITEDDYPISTNRAQKKPKHITKLEKLTKEIDFLYLPTYRRIEEELGTLFPEISEDLDPPENYHLSRSIFRRQKLKQQENAKTNYIELVKFGMKDVRTSLDLTLTNLKEFSRSKLNKLTLEYLRDIVNESYKTVNMKEINVIDDETIQKVINRVDEDILSSDTKKNLLTTLHNIARNTNELKEHDKVVWHYFLKLYAVLKELETKEIDISNFIRVCNKYLENKHMHYDNFNFKIELNSTNNEITLSQLSSGEKQIVSIFSKLYLSNTKHYFILIDEPELSLSVKWQRLFLEDIKNSPHNSGLVAVTHSPFIFDNTLDRFAHGLEEFRKCQK